MRRHLVFTIGVAILFGVRTVSASAKDLPCSDLRRAKAARLIKLFGPPLPTDMGMDFTHGLGCYTEDEEFPNPCDWKVAVSEDRNISEDRRLIVVETEHETGHGDWTDVLVLGCRDGKVTALFNYPVFRWLHLEEASADKLVLTTGMFEGGVFERQVYVWNKDAQTYVRKEP